MIQIQQLKLKLSHKPEDVLRRSAEALMVSPEEIQHLEILRRSIDARKKPDLTVVYTVEVLVRNEKKVLQRALKNKRAKEVFSESHRVIYRFPDEGTQSVKRGGPGRPVVVGAGPAGLFCSYYLARAGLRPILLERGKAIEERIRDVETFWNTGKLDPSSNVQFGEGGAGTFSDGKLNTLIKDKDGRGRAVLETFVRFGAKQEILYDAKPHIGTDVLSTVVRNMREEILALGGEVRFESCMTDLITEDGRVTGIVINNQNPLPCDRVVLAIGHSARDSFQMLYDRALHMEPKSFAVGFRIEHPQKMINLRQYGMEEILEIGAAPYKVTANPTTKRGVYSFCMCPGGYVVNASSEEGRLAVNGMSYSQRDGRNANSAIIVAVSPEDFGTTGPLAGVEFQRRLEEKAFSLGQGKIPLQRYGSFKDSVSGLPIEAGDTCPESEIQPCCKGDYCWADLSGILPEGCNQAFIQGMESFSAQIKDFDRPDAILSGIESRTSSPLRILRDENLQSNIRGIYPCGEGAGYAGGITSAAMDGLRIAEEICRSIPEEIHGSI